MSLRRTVGLTSLAVAIVVMIGLGFRPAPVWVDVSRVERGPLSVTIEEEGKTRVIDRYVVSAPVAAYARRIALKVGNEVKQGAELVRLEPLPSAVLDPRSHAAAKARIEAARATYEAARKQATAAEAESELAKRNYERIAKLCQVQCASKDDEDQALTRLRSSRAREQSLRFSVDVAGHELEAAETALAYAGATSGEEPIPIDSPIDGVVLKVLRESEGVVAAGEPLLELGNPAQLEVEVDLLSSDAVLVAPGMRVLFERWGGEPIVGLVRSIEPVGFTKVSALGVEEQRVLVIADLDADREVWRRLGDGYRVEASFILWHDDDVLTVPASALFRHGGGWALFVVDDDEARRVAVDVGRRNGLQAQILAGVKEGTLVVTHPGEAVDDGVAVQLR